MAQYRNVSGVDLTLALPDWPAGRLVAAGDVVTVPDDIAAKYVFPDVTWSVEAAPAEQQPAVDTTSTEA